MSLLKLLKKNRKQILEIAAQHGAFNVRVFGSVARGEADSKSDIDLLVSIKPGRSLLDHAAMHLEIEALLKHKVDVISERGLKQRYKEKVLSESIPL